MRVLVIGGYGLIGGYVMARLHRQGCALVGAGREVDPAARRMPYASWTRLDLRDMDEPAAWAPLLGGVDAVVNCAGALQESPRDDLAAAHLTAIRALYQACAGAGVRRVVHVSALGIGGEATPFAKTKRAAEAALAGLDLDWLILRPGLVLAPAAYGGSALLRALAGFPALIPAIHADQVVQVVSADDVAEAVARALAASAASRQTIELAASERTTLGEILVALRVWLGLPPARIVALPLPLVRLGAFLADAIAPLGWRSPMRSTTLAQLAAGIEAGACRGDLLGRTPEPLQAMLARWPSGVQERWFARAYFLKPLGLVTLIGFWLASGVLGMTIGSAGAVARLSPPLAPALAHAAVVAGAAVDIALAFACAFRRTAPWALKGMVAVSAAYLVAATLVRPGLWADPLGPLVKAIPAAVLALVMLAVMDER